MSFSSGPSGEFWGQERPPLSTIIKGILDQYPDGQIFKEMIQNADDAGAQTVWFYVDSRTHSPHNLPHPELAEYLGPALVAANDACFTPGDWKGLQKLQRSPKEKDPFKVGRFGIGFNSVYHITGSACGDPPPIANGTYQTVDYGRVSYTCDSGYEISPGVTTAEATCAGFGDWSGVPTCIARDCGAPPVVANGLKSDLSNTLVGSSVTYTCDSGYALFGSATLSCGADGSWGTPPVCYVTCPELPMFADGAIVYSNSERPVDSTATYSCTTGTIILGDFVRTCQNDGSWTTGVEPQCNQAVDGTRLAPHVGDSTVVDYTNMIMSFDDIGIGTGPPPALLCFIEPGGHNWYDPTGVPLWVDHGNPANRVGTSPGANQIILQGLILENVEGILLHRGASYYELDGLWCCGPNGGRNLNTNRCVTFTPCPTLPVLANGVITYNRDTNVAIYSCDGGYAMSSTADAERTCSSNKQWSGIELTCTAGCYELSMHNGAITYSSGSSGVRSYGTVATYSCPGPEFNLMGSTTRTCQSDGTWSGHQPICHGPCYLSDVENGMVSYDRESLPDNRSLMPIDTVATYQCNVGFIRRGPETRTCVDGSWSGLQPVCDVTDCGEPDPPVNGVIDLVSGVTTFGSLVMYSCDSCYELRGVPKRVCGGDGNWVPDAATCVLSDCNPPPPPVNGGVILSPDSSCGSQVIYHCDPGYLIMGSDARTCQPSGDWSEAAPVCEAVDCGSPAAPDNGKVTTSSTKYQSVADYSCNDGYTLSGSDHSTCDEHGNWIPDPPLCQPVDCGSLAHPANGLVDTSSGTTFTSEAVYSCDPGFNLDGEAVRTCGADGVWQPAAPTCKIVDCGPLSHPVNGAVSTDSGTTYISVALYSCENGYEINGPSQRTCTATGQWSDSSPTCDPVDCGELVAPSHGSVDIPEGTHFPSVASYSCDPGYNLTGCSTAQCQADGTWSCDPPFCADNVYIQLKFGRTSNCVEWSDWKVELFFTKMRSLILRAIQKYGNNVILPKENIAPGYFSCFQSTSEATFRTRITGTESVSAVEYAAMIQSWVESGVSSRLQWYIIKIDKTCPVRIESLEQDECP